MIICLTEVRRNDNESEGGRASKVPWTERGISERGMPSTALELEAMSIAHKERGEE